MEPLKKTWGHLIKTYNTSASGNVEQFSICSNDSIWEDDEKMATRLCENDDSSTSDNCYQPRRHRYVRNKNYDLGNLLQKMPNLATRPINGKCDYFSYDNFYSGSGTDHGTDPPNVLKRPISLNISQEQCFQVIVCLCINIVTCFTVNIDLILYFKKKSRIYYSLSPFR